MVVIEYRIVVPFTLEEFHRGLRYLDGRQRKEIASNSANGEQIDTLEHRSFTDLQEVPKIIQEKGRIPNRGMLCKTGTFTENRLYLGTRFPAWLRALVPTSALYIRERYYNCYPYSFCSYHSELFAEGMDFTIESLHVENDIGRNDNIYGDCSPSEKKEMKLQIVDITKPVESTAGVFQGDPTGFQCHVSGRGPLPKSSTIIADQGGKTSSSSTTSKIKYWFEHWIDEYKMKREIFLTKQQQEANQSSNSFFSSSSSSNNKKKSSWFGRNDDEDQNETTVAEKNFEKFLSENEHPPHLCIYKRSKVHITGVPFTSAIEEATQNSTVRDLAVHSFRNLFCWLPEWHHMTHEQITKYLEDVGGAVEM